MHFSHIIRWQAGKLSVGFAFTDMPNAHPHSDRQPLGSDGYPIKTLCILSVILTTYGKWDLLASQFSGTTSAGGTAGAASVLESGTDDTTEERQR